MVTELEKLGYKTDLQYGEDKVENQIAQIENMITKGVDAFGDSPDRWFCFNKRFGKSCERGY